MFSKASKEKTGLQITTGGNATFIGAGSQFTGNLTCHALRVDGTIFGDVTADGDIEISATGRVEGNFLKGKNIIVHGIVKSNIEADGFLRIHKKANVQGDVHAHALDIEAGAHFVGYSHTGDSKVIEGKAETKKIELKTEPIPHNKN